MPGPEPQVKDVETAVNQPLAELGRRAQGGRT